MADKYTPTTTHAAYGAGHPHLILTGGDVRQKIPLDGDRLTIGSGGDVDVSLEGLAALHAEIRHDMYDEYILVLHGPAETSARHEPIASLEGTVGEVLRTGARFVLGEWAFVYARDEYADHGIPFGGRSGGEGGHDHRQPDRPDYTGSIPVVAASPRRGR